MCVCVCEREHTDSIIMDAVMPQTDEDEITSIVTKRLWSNDIVEIFEHLENSSSSLQRRTSIE
jgi:hypothetical protein